MISNRLHARIKTYTGILQRFADRFWYPPLIALLAALDNLVLIIPSDGILISSSMLTPRRWLLFAASVTIGSTFGALLLAAFVEAQGLPWVLGLYPGLDETTTWIRTAEFFDQYGLLLVFGVALTPLVQQPAVILAGLANTPLFKLAIAIFAGRFIKFALLAYLGSHAPGMLARFWGLETELKDVGVNIDGSSSPPPS